MNILISTALLLFLTMAPAQATEPDSGFGDNYFSNTQLPGFSDPATTDDDAAGLAAIEPAAGDETGEDTAIGETPKLKTQHDVAPIGPATAIGATPEDSE